MKSGPAVNPAVAAVVIAAAVAVLLFVLYRGVTGSAGDNNPDTGKLSIKGDFSKINPADWEAERKKLEAAKGSYK